MIAEAARHGFVACRDRVGPVKKVRLLEMSVPEVMNRATISGAIEIGRHPGVVQVTFRAPVDRLERAGLLGYALEQYAT